MRIIVLGDTHGRDSWKEVVINEKFDKVVFVGDYFDTHDNISPSQQKENFKDIIAYKKANIEKVILLFGNHDFHYLENILDRYSGYQSGEAMNIGELLHSAIDGNLLQMCFVWEDMIITHAGITKTWCDNNNIGYKNYETIEEEINDLFKSSPNSFQFTCGRYYNPYGDEVEQSPIWVRPNSLLEDRAVEGLIQVVGHTTQKELVITDDIILVDTLGNANEYLIWDEFKLSVGKMNGKWIK